MYTVTWLLSEKCELYLGSCLKNADCTLVLSGECKLCFGSVWRMQAVLWFCLENEGCTLAPVWKVQAVPCFLSGECRLYFGSVWKMQAVTWFLSEECRVLLVKGNAYCDLAPVLRMHRLQLGFCLESKGHNLALVRGYRLQGQENAGCNLCLSSEGCRLWLG